MNKLLIAACLLFSCRGPGIKDTLKCAPTGVEVCDGIDNDCNGKVDDVLQVCETACAKGVQTCKNGVWQECSAQKPGVEVCDGKDNDCDGVVDNNIQASPCYPGNPSDVGFGECRYGVLRCVNGAFQCIGAVMPSHEDCDGKDNDCNGKVDDTGGGGMLDLVIALDYSGSMDVKLTAVVNNLTSFLHAYVNRTDVRVAAIAIPDWTNANDGKVTVLRDFQGVSSFIQYLGTLPTSNLNSGSEPSIDAIYMVADPANPLALGWGYNTKKVLVEFTDELPQSYEYPPHTLLATVNFANTNKLDVYVFTDFGIMNDWKAGVSNTYNLDPVSTNMAMAQVLSAAAESALCK